MKNKSYKFVDIFAGIGGFHIALHSLGADCVFASEKDSFARKTYQENFFQKNPSLFEDGNFNDDILQVDPETIPDFDILCAGFPCQPFSQAGFKRGFGEEHESRGNMFFILRDIIKAKRPKAIFLENVRHLEKHDDGRTFEIIKNTIEKELGYSFNYQVVKASDHGLPQHRPRLYMVGFRDESTSDSLFSFPKPEPLKMSMSDIFNAECPKKVGFTLRVGGRGSGLNDRRNWDSYLVNGQEKRLTVVEGKKMMGFPSDFVFNVSETQAMKQLGNSVAVNAIRATANKILEYLDLHYTEDNKCKRKDLVLDLVSA
jgi:DNA (cytosine-5)-methyltransferase 1